jgi:hypothetical protein
MIYDKINILLRCHSLINLQCTPEIVFMLRAKRFSKTQRVLVKLVIGLQIERKERRQRSSREEDRNPGGRMG